MANFNSKEDSRKGICYIENGCLYWNNGSGATIQEPSLLVGEDDKDGTCTLIRYGEAKFLREELMEKAAVYTKAGLGHLSVIEPDPERVSLEEQCYILRRAAEYSASPFVGELSRRLNTDPDNVLSWLRGELQRVPIEI